MEDCIKALGAISCWLKGNEGISIDGSLIKCPCLVIKAVNCEGDEIRGRATAEQLKGEYTRLWGTSHTGLLVGRRYFEAAGRILEWLERY
jgi:hypothetical protein